MLLGVEKSHGIKFMRRGRPGCAFAWLVVIPAAHTEMTSVLYGSGLNYQVGNPVRSEIRQVDRKIEELRIVVEKLGAGAGAAAAGSAPAAASAVAEMDGRITALRDEVGTMRGLVDGLGGRVDGLAVGEISTRVQRMESAQVGASGMLMEMRSLLDKLAARVDALERSAAAVAPAPVA